MFNVRHFTGGGTETTMAAQSYEVVDTGPNVSVRVWATVMKDGDPIGEWSGVRGTGSNPGEAMVLITNRFGVPLETVYLVG